MGNAITGCSDHTLGVFRCIWSYWWCLVGNAKGYCQRSGSEDLGGSCKERTNLISETSSVQVKNRHSYFFWCEIFQWRFKAEGEEIVLRGLSVGVLLQDPPIGTDFRGLMWNLTFSPRPSSGIGVLQSRVSGCQLYSDKDLMANQGGSGGILYRVRV